MYGKLYKLIFALIAILLLILFYFSLPNPLFKTPSSFVIEDSKGELLGASIASDGQWRFPAVDTVPYKFEKCIITFEDKRFRYHPGFDPFSLARAIRQNIKKHTTVSGASTLSMQVIRLSRKKPRTIWQKLIEIVLAVRLELSYSKDEILTLYAGNAPFGTNVVGLDAAAWRYYGRDAGTLSWGEMASLAVLPNSPSLVHPGRNRNYLLKKRNWLLNKLQQNHTIDAVTARLAKLEPLPGRPLPLPRIAPHLLSRFKSDWSTSEKRSTRLKTSIEANLQKNVSAILQRYHQQFKANGVNNISALILDVETGKALSYNGNIDERNDPEMESDVDMIPALRSPGSTLKPLLYAAMLTDGELLPDALVPDIPTQVGGYTPKNFDLGYDGAIPASKALSRSLNIPAVKMLQQYKYPRFYRQLKKLGISTIDKPADFYGLSLILGGCEISMWELAGIYASMARSLNHYGVNNGKYNPKDFFMASYKASPLPTDSKPIPGAAGTLNYASLWFTFSAMQEVMRPGEEGLWQQFSSSRRIAWKTGTSFGFRDGWAIGLTPEHVICIWVGNADGEGRPGLTGIDTAAPILFELFGLLPSGGWFEAPADQLIPIQVCRQSGFRAGSVCPDKESRYIPISGLKTASCPWHQLIHLDPSQRFQVNSDCESTTSMIHVPWFVLPPAMEYYYKQRHTDYKALPPFKQGCISSEAIRQMEMIYPKNNAKVFIPLEADGKLGDAIFSAAHRMAGIKIFWYIDNEYLGTTVDFHQLAIQTRPGKHILTLVDAKGNRLIQRFEVLEKEKE